MNKEQALLALSYKNLSTQQKEQILAQMGLIASENTIQSELLQTTLAQKGVSAEKSKAILIELGLMNQQTGELLTQKACTKADLEAILAQKGITGAQAEGIISALGLSGANAGLTASFGLLGKAIWGVTKALLSNPITWIVAGFAGLVAITDAVTTSTEEYKEQLDDLKSEYNEITSEIQSVNSELQTTTDRMKELEGKDSLTFTEKEEYDNLVKTNNELQRKIDLLELEEKQKNKEKNKTFVDTMVSDTENPFEHEVNPNGKTEGQYQISDNYLTSETGYIEAQFEIRDQLLEDLANAETEKEKERIQKRIDEIEKYLNDKNDEWKNVSDGISYIENPTTEDDKAVNEWLDYIADFQDRMAIAMSKDDASSNAQYKTNTFNRVVDNWQFDETVQGLQDLGKEGKVTAEMLNDPKYDEFINKLVSLGVVDSADNLENVALAFNSVADSAENAADSASQYNNETDISSISDMISSINKLSEGFEELDKIYTDIKDKGSFDFKLLDDDKFKKNFSGLESYSDFIESVTSSPNDIKKCKSAFNALVTEWIDDTGVLNNLTEANKDLTVSMLEQMGVSNAQEIVNQRLKAAQLNAKIATEATTYEVLRQVGAWINDGEAIGYTKTALFDLISTERIFNNSNLNVAGKIAQLEQLAISFGITADAAGTAGLKMSMLNEIKIAKRDGASKEDIKKIEESYLNYAQSQYQKTFEGRFGKLKTFNYSGSTKSNKTSSIKKQVAEIFDWIEVRMSRLKRNIKNLSDTVSNTFKSWSTRRKSLKKEISEISKALSAQKSASSKYLKKANSVDLSESYKKKVREGKIDIESIKDEKLKEKIKKYQEYYQAYLNSKDAEKELEKQLSEAYREQFDLIESEYEGKISLIESNITALENAISLAEAKGKQVGGSYYDDIIAAERERIAALGNEYQALQAQLDAMVASGQIVKYSEEWYAMQNEINQVKQSWDEANISLEQYLQNQREADWSIFDSNQEKIGDVASDNSFLLGLLEDEDMYDENGNITDFGNAANGLRLANMDLYTQQLENYTDELARLEEEYDDKSNTYYLERKRELIEAQQEAINAIKDERQALIDLAKEGYDALLDHMQKIIDKRKEAFNEIKDLRDYEKSIKEQTDEIDVIQKQLIAYQGDDSEESRSTIQKLQQSLKEAQDNLEETQYDKYIKDQEQMYDKLMEDTQNWVDELFENESALLQGIIDNATANSDRIISIVKQIAEQAGYTIQDEQSTELTDVLQREGYARGSKNIPYKQNNWIHAGELLYRTTDGGLLMPLNSGDKVFTSAMAENLWDMAQMNLHPVVPNYDVSPLVNKVIGSNTWSGDVVFNVEMYGVNDPQEFARQIKLVYSNNTGNVRNMIQTDVFSGDMLAHKKYL